MLFLDTTLPKPIDAIFSAGIPFYDDSYPYFKRRRLFVMSKPIHQPDLPAGVRAEALRLLGKYRK